MSYLKDIVTAALREELLYEPLRCAKAHKYVVRNAIANEFRISSFADNPTLERIIPKFVPKYVGFLRMYKFNPTNSELVYLLNLRCIPAEFYLVGYLTRLYFKCQNTSSFWRALNNLRESSLYRILSNDIMCSFPNKTRKQVCKEFAEVHFRENTLVTHYLDEASIF